MSLFFCVPHPACPQYLPREKKKVLETDMRRTATQMCRNSSPRLCAWQKREKCPFSLAIDYIGLIVIPACAIVDRIGVSHVSGGVDTIGFTDNHILFFQAETSSPTRQVSIERLSIDCLYLKALTSL
jgi:hypothetical protein